jgi:hypothetical protein
VLVWLRMSETGKRLPAISHRQIHPAYAIRFEWRGFEVVFPLSRRMTWKGRRRALELPLSPEYLFFRFDWQNLLPIFGAPGAVPVVSRECKPAAAHKTEISALQSLPLTYPYTRTYVSGLVT